MSKTSSYGVKSNISKTNLLGFLIEPDINKKNYWQLMCLLAVFFMQMRILWYVHREHPFFMWSLFSKIVSSQMFHISLSILMWSICAIILISDICLYIYGRIKQILKINVLLLSPMGEGCVSEPRWNYFHLLANIDIMIRPLRIYFFRDLHITFEHGKSKNFFMDSVIESFSSRVFTSAKDRKALQLQEARGMPEWSWLSNWIHMARAIVADFLAPQTTGKDFLAPHTTGKDRQGDARNKIPETSRRSLFKTRF